jgi:hypothetical protein
MGDPKYKHQQLAIAHLVNDAVGTNANTAQTRQLPF